MTKDEALKLALEALEDLGMKHYESTGEMLYKETFTAIKKALDKPEQKPIAYVIWNENNVPNLTFDLPKENDVYDALYHKITWIGLTRDEILETRWHNKSSYKFAKVLESKLKERNS